MIDGVGARGWDDDRKPAASNRGVRFDGRALFTPPDTVVVSVLYVLSC